MKITRKVLSRRHLVRMGIGLAPVLGGVRFSGTAGATASKDYPVANGWFYSQTGPGDGTGFAILNHDGIPFWDQFNALGGIAALGYPVSRRFIYKGFTNQAFQKAILQWQSESATVNFLNIFDELSDAGKDAELETTKLTPAGQDWSGDVGLPWAEVVARHLSLLDHNPAIKEKFLANPYWMDHYGLPMGYEDLGDVKVLRAQRAAFQQWMNEVPWASAGEVVVANGGDIAKELGLFPATAGLPHSSDIIPSVVLEDGTASPPDNQPIPVSVAPVQPEWLASQDVLPGPSNRPDLRFGGVLASDLQIYGEPENVTALNISWTREQYQWERMSTLDPSQFDLTATDRNYRTDLEQVGLAFRTADYANGGQGNQVPPDGMDLPWNDPNNHWGMFLHQLALSRLPTPSGRAAGDRNPVAHWTIWNEPDICVQGHPGFSWNTAQRAADYLKLLRTGWHAVKSADPTLGVVFGSIGIVDADCDVDKTGMSFFNEFMNEADKDPITSATNEFYFNAMSLNLHKEPERIGEMVKKYSRALSEVESQSGGAGKKEVWLMEMGIPTSTEPIDPKTNGGLVATPEEQKHFLWQGYANALIAGADRIAVYGMRDYLQDSSAYVALRKALRFLKNTHDAGHPPDPTFLQNRPRKWPDQYGPEMYHHDNIVRIDLPGPGFITTMFYNRSSQPISFRLRFRNFNVGNATIVKVKVDGVEERLQLPGWGDWRLKWSEHFERLVLVGPRPFTYEETLAGATALFDAPWGQEIYFVGGGTTMFRYSADVLLEDERTFPSHWEDVNHIFTTCGGWGCENEDLPKGWV